MMNLLEFKKPQRYIGNEWNVIKKPHKNRIRICLCYPDLYEIGMSNLGLRIIYGLLNSYDDVVCERVFLPDYDYIEFLQATNTKLASLETKTYLSDFDVLGFNLNYELNFINFLKVLYLGGVELKSKERKKPLVIVGGIANPEPIADFVDAFFIGEFEEVAKSFIDVLRKSSDKQHQLMLLSQLDGFYVPEFYNFYKETDKYFFEKKYKEAKLPITRVYVKNFNDVFYPTDWLVPHTQIIHDRAQVEIARGCPNRCKFCQARSVYYPYREKKVDTVINLCKTIYEKTGYENFSFLALSASDYSRIEELISTALDYFSKYKIGLSLPSLRADDVFNQLYKKLFLNKKTSLTVAIEAANDSLRDRLGKKIDTKKLFEAIKFLRSIGTRHIKLYFMFGLPEETEEDIFAIANFLSRLQEDTRLLLNVSINCFVPKPFSIWQDYPMQDFETLQKKRALLLKSIQSIKYINVSIQKVEYSILEAVLSRADRDFSKVIEEMFLASLKLGKNFDTFDLNNWKAVSEKEGIDYNSYIYRINQNFAWSFIALNEPRN